MDIISHGKSILIFKFSNWPIFKFSRSPFSGSRSHPHPFSPSPILTLPVRRGVPSFSEFQARTVLGGGHSSLGCTAQSVFEFWQGFCSGPLTQGYSGLTHSGSELLNNYKFIPYRKPSNPLILKGSMVNSYRLNPWERIRNRNKTDDHEVIKRE